MRNIVVTERTILPGIELLRNGLFTELNVEMQVAEQKNKNKYKHK